MNKSMALIIALSMIITSLNFYGQNNSAQKLLSKKENGLSIAGYSEIQYLNPENENSELNVKRLSILFGYKFDKRTQFITELQVENIKEVFIEQAFLQYNLKEDMNLRAGLMLVPMGIINEYHEPTSFNGVNRPGVDIALIPSTWREIGIGIEGRINKLPINYQVYIFNGFNSGEKDLDTGRFSTRLTGRNPFRGARQKGMESKFNSVNFSTRIEYNEISGLNLGFSSYFGETQSDIGIEEDGASVGMSMVGFDAKYKNKRFTSRGQLVYVSLSNTNDFNKLYNSDLGSSMLGWYLEASYNLLSEKNSQKLNGFVRYDYYDTHNSVESIIDRKQSYKRNDWTLGLTYFLAKEVVFKIDYQTKANSDSSLESDSQVNLGIGLRF